MADPISAVEQRKSRLAALRALKEADERSKTPEDKDDGGKDQGEVDKVSQDVGVDSQPRSSSEERIRTVEDEVCVPNCESRPRADCANRNTYLSSSTLRLGIL